MLAAQGADLDAFNRKLALDHTAPVVVELKAPASGFVSRCDAHILGETIRDLGGGRFRGIVYPVRLTHNGQPLIYKATQIPLAAKDLTPGCSAVAFEIWAVTALVVKAMCAQALCEMTFSGIVDEGCSYVHPCRPATLVPQR